MSQRCPYLGNLYASASLPNDLPLFYCTSLSTCHCSFHPCPFSPLCALDTRRFLNSSRMCMLSTACFSSICSIIPLLFSHPKNVHTVGAVLTVLLFFLCAAASLNQSPHCLYSSILSLAVFQVNCFCLYVRDFFHLFTRCTNLLLIELYCSHVLGGTPLTCCFCIFILRSQRMPSVRVPFSKSTCVFVSVLLIVTSSSFHVDISSPP